MNKFISIDKFIKIDNKNELENTNKCFLKEQNNNNIDICENKREIPYENNNRETKVISEKDKFDSQTHNHY